MPGGTAIELLEQRPQEHPKGTDRAPVRSAAAVAAAGRQAAHVLAAVVRTPDATPLTCPRPLLFRQAPPRTGTVSAGGGISGAGSAGVERADRGDGESE